MKCTKPVANEGFLLLLKYKEIHKMQQNKNGLIEHEAFFSNL